MDSQATQTQSGGTSQGRYEAIACVQCNEINPRKKPRQCHTCGNWWHLTCIPLTREQSNNLPVWNCSPCISGESIGSSIDAPSGQRHSPPDDWAATLAHLKKNVPVLRRIPKSVRGILADKLSSRIEGALNTSQRMAWWELFSFTYSYLRSPVSGGIER